MRAAAGMHDIDLAFRAGEAQRVPFLFLPAVFAAPGLADDVARNVVSEPVRDLAELIDRADAGFFIELAQRGLVGVFVLVDAALRHLPDMRHVDMFGAAGAAADEHLALAVEHHDAGARAVGQRFIRGHDELLSRTRCSAIARRKTRVNALMAMHRRAGTVKN